jgi:hypothetical protein
MPYRAKYVYRKRLLPQASYDVYRGIHDARMGRRLCVIWKQDIDTRHVRWIAARRYPDYPRGVSYTTRDTAVDDYLVAREQEKTAWSSSPTPETRVGTTTPR